MRFYIGDYIKVQPNFQKKVGFVIGQKLHYLIYHNPYRSSSLYELKMTAITNHFYEL